MNISLADARVQWGEELFGNSGRKDDTRMTWTCYGAVGSRLEDGQPGGWADVYHSKIRGFTSKVKQHRIIIQKNSWIQSSCSFQCFPFCFPAVSVWRNRVLPNLCFDHEQQKVWHCLIGREKKDSAFFPCKFLVFRVFDSLPRISSLKTILSHDGSRDIV